MVFDLTILQPFVGAIYGALGYAVNAAKHKGTDDAKFDPKNFFITVAIGLAVNTGAGFTGNAEFGSLPVVTALTVLFDKAASFWHK